MSRYKQSVKAPFGTPKEWPQWEDQLGNVYCPGDMVAVATVRYKSPALVIGTVEKINRINSKGEEIGRWSHNPQDPNNPTLIPSCTVTVRRKSRWNSQTEESYTYQDPSNIIRINP